MTSIEQQIEGIVDSILVDYLQGRDIDRIEPFRHPDKDVIIDIIEKLRRIVFPGYFLSAADLREHWHFLTDTAAFPKLQFPPTVIFCLPFPHPRNSTA